MIILLTLLFVLFTLLPALALAAASPDGIWEELNTRSPLSTEPDGREPWVKPDVFREFRLNASALASLLDQAPRREAATAARAPQVQARITIPSPDGSYRTVVFEDSPVMAPELAAKFPDIRTFMGYLAEDPTVTVAFDWTPAGFHAQVLAPEGAWYVDPYRIGVSYASYFKRDYRPDKAFTDHPARLPSAGKSSPGRLPLTAPAAGGDKLRKYRLAVSCTPEYAQYHCDGVCTDKTKPMAAIATTIQRVRQIYNRELAIDFTLVADNDRLIYIDPATSPFTNNNSNRLIEQNQTEVDKTIGDANYDIGHVFSLGGGGLGALGVPCQTGKKAGALTGTRDPKGDAFDVDYVCHEMGHQFNADHTYNGRGGNCSADQYALHAAYEPGSGTTIMAYAGQCAEDNTQSYGDNIFHSVNFDQIQAYVSQKGTCHTLEGSNTIPTVQVPAAYTIPRGTPFMLTGSGADPGGNVLTYLWEEHSRSGRQAALNAHDDGESPLFRTYRPTLTGTRIFPRLETILAGISDPGERLPQIGRTMNFRLVVRNGRGGVAYGTTKVTVDGIAGPFRATYPTAGLELNGAVEVKWDKAGTDQPPVNATAVDIFLSTDGGKTFDFTNPLKTGVPNTGAAQVTLPDVRTTRGRIMIKAADNAFFAINDGDFTISGTAAAGNISVTPMTGLFVSGEEKGPFTSLSKEYTLRNTGTATVNWSTAKTQSWVNVAPAGGTLPAGEQIVVTVSVTGAENLAQDQYLDTLTFNNDTNGVGTTTRTVYLLVGKNIDAGLLVSDPDDFQSRGFAGGPFYPTAKTYRIMNNGTATVNWSVVAEQNRLTVTPANGTLDPGDETAVTASLKDDCKNLTAGVYTDTLTFQIENKSTNPATYVPMAVRAATITVVTQEEEGALDVDPPQAWNAAGYSGGPFVPASKNYTLRNVGNNVLNWTAAKTRDWVSLSATGGTLAPGAAVTVAVAINAAGLAVGTYSETITFTNTTNNVGTTTRTLQLSVRSGPGVLSVTPDEAYALSGNRNGPFTPASKQYTLKNTGGESIDWVIYTERSWINVIPFEGTLAPGASAVVTVTPNMITNSVLPGAYTNSIFFMNKTNRRGDASRSVPLTVAAETTPGPFYISPAEGHSFRGKWGGPFLPASVDFTLQNITDGEVKWTTGLDASWLALTPASGTIPAGESATVKATLKSAAHLLGPNSYANTVYFGDEGSGRLFKRTINLTAAEKGDINGNGTVELADSVLSLQVTGGGETSSLRTDYRDSGTDVNGDEKIGPAESLFALQHAAGLRTGGGFVLKSSAFKNGASIPLRYLEDGLSPPLTWSGAPAGTKSFVLLLEDPDEIPNLELIRGYWIVYDIPGVVASLAEGAGAENGKKLPSGAKHGKTNWEKNNTFYRGLEPTQSTGPHRFYFRLYALSEATISPAGEATKDNIEAAMAGKILGRCELMGTYFRP